MNDMERRLKKRIARKVAWTQRCLENIDKEISGLQFDQPDWADVGTTIESALTDLTLCRDLIGNYQREVDGQANANASPTSSMPTAQPPPKK